MHLIWGSPNDGNPSLQNDPDNCFFLLLLCFQILTRGRGGAISTVVMMATDGPSWYIQHIF